MDYLCLSVNQFACNIVLLFCNLCYVALLKRFCFHCIAITFTVVFPSSMDNASGFLLLNIFAVENCYEKFFEWSMCITIASFFYYYELQGIVVHVL